MKTFKGFLEEGQKKDGTVTFGKTKTKEIQAGAQEIAKRVSKDLKRQQKENPGAPTVANFNRIDPKTGEEKFSKPGSVQRQKEIEALLRLTREWKKKQG
jgi:hypothetical protein